MPGWCLYLQKHLTEISIVVVGLVILLVVDAQTRGASNLETLQTENVIRVGFAVEAPYSYLGDDLTITGESIKSAKHIISQLGIDNIEWVLMPFGDLISALQSRRIDVAAAGMYITPQREKLVRFSLPMLLVEPALLVRENFPHQTIREAAIYQDTEITISVMSGSVEEQILRDLGRTENVQAFPDFRSAEAAVVSGDADVLLMSMPSVRHAAENSESNLKAIQFKNEDIKRYQTGFAFNINDCELARAWNEEAIRWLKSDDYLKMLETFGFDAPQVPQGKSW